MHLSFCSTCMNRIDQVICTLPTNLLDNSNSLIDFILVDYNTVDTLHDFVVTNLSKYLESGQLKYYRTDELLYWHASIAKNTAHMLATGKYVVNLDCDNYIGKNGGDLLLDIFEKNGDDILISQSQNIYGSGNTGRISLSKENFIKLGGYNEFFYPMGYQDPDLVDRAIHFGLKYINIDSNNKTIPNTKKESVKNIGLNIEYEKMNSINILISKLNIKNNDLVANKCKKHIGILNVKRIFN